MERHLHESVLRRAWSDTIQAQRSARFMWFGEGIMAAGWGALFAALAPPGAGVSEQVLRAVGGGLIGLLLAVIFIFTCNFVLAPYKQRSEARRLASDWRLTLRSKVLEIIRSHGELPIDLPEIMMELGLEHGNAAHNRLVNDAITQLQTIGEIYHTKRGSINGWIVIIE